MREILSKALVGMSSLVIDLLANTHHTMSRLLTYLASTLIVARTERKWSGICMGKNGRQPTADGGRPGQWRTTA
jgi:hypothetical protein